MKDVFDEIADAQQADAESMGLQLREEEAVRVLCGFFHRCGRDELDEQFDREEAGCGGCELCGRL